MRQRSYGTWVTYVRGYRRRIAKLRHYQTLRSDGRGLNAVGEVRVGAAYSSVEACKINDKNKHRGTVKYLIPPPLNNKASVETYKSNTQGYVSMCTATAIMWVNSPYTTKNTFTLEKNNVLSAAFLTWWVARTREVEVVLMHETIRMPSMTTRALRKFFLKCGDEIPVQLKSKQAGK